ncbi:MAG TPA: hypothetical protein VJU17_01440 [Gemmatimonadales bacterium]|nr:hypothetical protein [Gemmatimonadales bacterium]
MRLELAGPVALTCFEGVIESKPPELRPTTKIQQQANLQRGCSQVIQYLCSMHGLESGQRLNLNQNFAIYHNISPKMTDHISAKIDLDGHFPADGEALRTEH